VVFTTRSPKKATDTLQRLQQHLVDSGHPPSSSRVTFVPESVDLANLVSVRALSRRLLASFPKLDSVILNAGLGGWTGIHWPLAVWSVLTDLIHAVSWPAYKLASAGVVTDPQTRLGPDAEPRLGAVFCANVFGHYMLAHNVVPLLKRAGDLAAAGRIVWVSSLEATVKLLDVDDLQGLRTATPYESSKALTDVLAITADLPSSAPWVKSFYDDNANNTTTTETTADAKHPTMYLSHPGICGSGILPLSLPLYYLMMAAFWLARILGSPWHTLSTYLGACAPVWLALTPRSALDDAEAPYRRHGGGRVKWGSSCSLSGCERPACTEVDGWGYGGVVGPAVLQEDRCRRRKRGAVDLTRERKVEFEVLGRECWRRMEELRVQWDALLDQAEGMDST
jgi:3-keto steroid reductase